MTPLISTVTRPLHDRYVHDSSARSSELVGRDTARYSDTVRSRAIPRDSMRYTKSILQTRPSPFRPVYQYGQLPDIWISDGPDIRLLVWNICIYPANSEELSISTRWQNGHYPVNPDGAGASRIHTLATTYTSTVKRQWLSPKTASLASGAAGVSLVLQMGQPTATTACHTASGRA